MRLVARETAGLPPVAGPASFVGYVAPSKRVETARLLDADGRVLDEAVVRFGVYHLNVENVATVNPRTIHLDGATLDGLITIGPFPGDRR